MSTTLASLIKVRDRPFTPIEQATIDTLDREISALAAQVRDHAIAPVHPVLAKILAAASNMRMISPDPNDDAWRRAFLAAIARLDHDTQHFLQDLVTPHAFRRPMRADETAQAYLHGVFGDSWTRLTIMSRPAPEGLEILTKLAFSPNLLPAQKAICALGENPAAAEMVSHLYHHGRKPGEGRFFVRSYPDNLDAVIDARDDTAVYRGGETVTIVRDVLNAFPCHAEAYVGVVHLAADTESAGPDEAQAIRDLKVQALEVVGIASRAWRDSRGLGPGPFLR